MLKQSFLKPEAVMLHLPLVFKKQFKVITPPHADFAITQNDCLTRGIKTQGKNCAY